MWERVLEWWGANGWLVNGMQEVRQPALLPATRSRRCGDLVSHVAGKLLADQGTADPKGLGHRGHNSTTAES